MEFFIEMPVQLWIHRELLGSQYKIRTRKNKVLMFCTLVLLKKERRQAMTFMPVM